MATSNNKLCELKGHNRTVEKILISNDGQTITSIGHDKQIISSSENHHQIIYSTSISKNSEVRSIELSQDATTIAIGQKKGLVTIKEANTRNIILNIKVGEDHFDLVRNSIYSLLYSACKTYLAVGVKVEGPEDKIYQRVLVYKIDYQQKVAKLHKDFRISLRSAVKLYLGV